MKEFSREQSNSGCWHPLPKPESNRDRFGVEVSELCATGKVSPGEQATKVTDLRQHVTELNRPVFISSEEVTHNLRYRERESGEQTSTVFFNQIEVTVLNTTGKGNAGERATAEIFA